MNTLSAIIILAPALAVGISRDVQFAKRKAIEPLQRSIIFYCIILVLAGVASILWPEPFRGVGIGIGIFTGIGIAVSFFLIHRTKSALSRDSLDRPTGAVDRPHDYWRDRGY
ncbi:hypothetical protein [Corynebacterium dentalis]|uniref:hypothetical protein n=1 Tax=Corynebacterium dentalis TaxID=2014528 RepID=UPI000C07DFD0|nr:hypothetical protein [Corynebacterium dentalis]